MKTLFFFTSSYPCGTGETFIENEIMFLARSFDNVVLVTNDLYSQQTRVVPSNVSIERMSYHLTPMQAYSSILSVFSRLFWQEIRNIRKYNTVPFNRLVINTLLVSIAKKKYFERYILEVISKHSDKTDEIYLYSYWANDIALSIAAISKKINIRKCVCRAHGWDVYFEANDARYLPLRRYLIENMDAIYFISNRGADYYGILFPDLTEKMRVSRLGVRHVMELKQHKKNNVLRIVTCSNVIELKRVHLVAQSLSMIDSIDVEWVHFGDGTLFNDLKSLCNVILSNKNNIKYSLRGRVQNELVNQFFADTFVDLFINVSTTEGIPVSIMEAMSFGVPCMATAVGGSPEIVNNENGELLNPNISADELARKIEAFEGLSDAKKTIKHVAAYRTWSDKYNAEKNYPAFISEIMV